LLLSRFRVRRWSCAAQHRVPWRQPRADAPVWRGAERQSRDRLLHRLPRGFATEQNGGQRLSRRCGSVGRRCARLRTGIAWAARRPDQQQRHREQIRRRRRWRCS